MKLLDIVKENLKKIITNHCTPGESKSAPWSGMRMGRTISLDDKAMQLLSETVRNIMKWRPVIKEKFTEDYLKDRMIDIIFSCHVFPPSTLDTKVLKETQKLLRRLRRTTESWVFLIPIVNLKMIGLKKISIGEVDFYDLNPKTFKYLESKFGTRVGYQKLLTERHSELIKHSINALAVAKAAAGEIQKAKNISLFKVESSLNILRLYNFMSDIGIQREFPTTLGREDIYFRNLRTKTCGSTHGGPPPSSFFPFLIDKQKLDLMRKRFQLSTFNKLLRRTWSTKLAQKISMAIHWYGLGIKDKHEVDRFVKLIIALESLLLRQKDRLKKQFLADRAAFILGRDKKAREEIYKLVSELYTIRSEIVHEGKHDISEEDILKLIALVRTLIFAMMKISLRLQSLEDVDKRIEEIKFGSQIRGV